MAHELRRAFGQAAQQSCDTFERQLAGLRDAAEVVGGDEAGVIGLFARIARQQFQSAGLHALLEHQARLFSPAARGEQCAKLGELHGRRGCADYGVFLGQAQGDFEEPREHVDVFVAVKMRGRDAGIRGCW